MIDQKVLNDIKEKEQELWITNSYKWWNQEMYDYLYKKWYNKFEIYTEIIWENVKKPTKYFYNMDDTLDWIHNWKEDDIWIAYIDWTYVYNWLNNDCNLEYCKENNIPILPLNQPTWCFVISPHSLWIWWKQWTYLPIEEQNILWRIRDFFWWEQWQNDIIINWYKVAWITQVWWHVIIHFSFLVDIDLIKNICLKPMAKTPKWITELTWKTREDFINFLKTWLIN